MEAKHNLPLSQQELLEAARKTLEIHTAQMLDYPETIFSEQKKRTMRQWLTDQWVDFRCWLADLLECIAESIRPY